MNKVGISFLIIGILVLGIVIGIFAFDYPKTGLLPEVKLSDVESVSFRNVLIVNKPGFVSSADVERIGNIGSDWKCYIDNVDPLEDSCSSQFCTDFRVGFTCFKRVSYNV